MKTTLSTLAASLTLLSPLFSQDRPRDISPEDLQMEQHWNLSDRFDKMLKDRSDKALIERLIQESTAEMELPEPPAFKFHPGTPPWVIGLAVQGLDPFMRSHLSLPEHIGVRVIRVMPGAPAAAAGVQEDDILLSANEVGLSSMNGLKEQVEKAGKEGRPLKLEFIRKGKRDTLVIQPRDPESPPLVDAPPAAREPNPVERRLAGLQKRLEQQQHQIEELRRQVQELRAQQNPRQKRKVREQAKQKREIREEASPRPEAR
ncbi:PDZ domain-containing protein [Luteolibacter marinus]|uniref:PDZ domain-containing protein n=1 Tax=Luteolibacter marinus TaxID=2776705 RepID=UPI001866A7B0|nr:PDZ domain-containing protein [Luteolibacter marinus]